LNWRRSYQTIYDGIQRPLEAIRAIAGNTITRGIEVAPVDHEKKWDFVPVAKVGDKVVAGDILGTVQENHCGGAPRDGSQRRFRRSG
jgi:vacuolar-type H+-ATPase catalytic subunit A/Vma1